MSRCPFWWLSRRPYCCYTLINHFRIRSCCQFAIDQIDQLLTASLGSWPKPSKPLMRWGVDEGGISPTIFFNILWVHHCYQYQIKKNHYRILVHNHSLAPLIMLFYNAACFIGLLQKPHWSQVDSGITQGAVQKTQLTLTRYCPPPHDPPVSSSHFSFPAVTTGKMLSFSFR